MGEGGYAHCTGIGSLYGGCLRQRCLHNTRQQQDKPNLQTLTHSKGCVCGRRAPDFFCHASCPAMRLLLFWSPATQTMQGRPALAPPTPTPTPACPRHSPDVEWVEAVNILGWVKALYDGLLIDVPRQRQLHQQAVNSWVPVGGDRGRKCE